MGIIKKSNKLGSKLVTFWFKLVTFIKGHKFKLVTFHKGHKFGKITTLGKGHNFKLVIICKGHKFELKGHKFGPKVVTFKKVTSLGPNL